MSGHPQISHPYPPSSPPRAPRTQQSNQYTPSRPGNEESYPLYDIQNRSSPPSSPPQISTKPQSGHRFGFGRRQSIGERVGEEIISEHQHSGKGSEYPADWTKEDEEAEQEFIRKGMFDWDEMKRWQFWIRKEWWYWYVGLIVLGVLVCLMAIFHDDIVDWLTPAVNWMKNLTAGWVIPIVVIFVLSFPPLFGQEIVAILCGLVWGLWEGFGIVAAGTFLGEVANFIVFKYWCRHRAEKYEQKNLNYAVMAHVVRESGFFFIFVVRLSAIPGHFTTVVFATCGMGLFVFSLACLLTLPKQLIVVYLGVLFKAKQKSTKSRIISYTVLIVGFIITVAAAWYCYREMNRARVVVWRKQRMALASKGVSIDPVTGEQRPRKSYPAGALDEEEDIRSPLTHERSQSHEYETRPNPHEYQTYPNQQFDTHYQTADGTTVYHVNSTNIPEQDIGGGYRQQAPPSFPQARPSAPGIHRNPTTVSNYNYAGEPAPMPTSFPVPAPVQQVQQGYNYAQR